MSHIEVPLLTVTIRRDANTQTPVNVPPHELPVLRSVFGKENVIESESEATASIVPDDEHSRLCAKYGEQVVVKIFGDDGGDRLSEVVRRHAVSKAKAKAKGESETEK